MEEKRQFVQNPDGTISTIEANRERNDYNLTAKPAQSNPNRSEAEDRLQAVKNMNKEIYNPQNKK